MTSRLQKSGQGLSFGAQWSLPSLFSHDSAVSRLHQLLHSCHLDHQQRQQQHSNTPAHLSWPFDGADDSESTVECLGCSLDAPTRSSVGGPLLSDASSHPPSACSAASNLLVGCPDLRKDLFCPLVDSQFWTEFQSRPRLDAMRQSLFWLLVLLCLVGVIFALLLARTSIVLLSLPVLLVWCLLVSILFSIFNSTVSVFFLCV
ncbi:unnamed protein product [Schistocephalus solidus]|uniref:Uncharacterized protein n=1 Tax=Schistocephalus solidus TaxID=70667 RepID=A0A183TQE1_SCHSO|nr:unnamed protein product [Schistocephalus solidus]